MIPLEVVEEADADVSHRSIHHPRHPVHEVNLRHPRHVHHHHRIPNVPVLSCLRCLWEEEMVMEEEEEQEESSIRTLQYTVDPQACDIQHGKEELMDNKRAVYLEGCRPCHTWRG